MMGKGSQKLIDKFNTRFPVGSPFRWRSVGRDGVPHQTLTVRFPAYNEKNGYISIDPRFVDYAREETK